MTKSTTASMGVGVITAIASSLCCITPVIAIFAGSSSLASSFQWIEPARPWLIGLTIAALGVAWYLQLRPVPVDNCNCEVPVTSFWKGRTFLSMVTVFSILMFAFPLYANIIIPNSGVDVAAYENAEQLETIDIEVFGMTCTGCEIHVEKAVGDIEGVASVQASHKDKKATIVFDPTKADIEALKQAIQSTEYEIGNVKIIQPSKIH